MDSAPILLSKLHRPPVNAGHVHRPSLIDKINQAPQHSLILLSAPAGYGKSTLISCWLDDCTTPAAWLSLDEHDNDPHEFISYFIAAIQTIYPHAAPNTRAIVDSGVLPPPGVLAVMVANELDMIEQHFIVVLDDIHLISNRSVLEFLDLLAKHPRTSGQFVLIGRRDPGLSIASLRAKGLITEIRMRDLRFSNHEAKDFLQLSMAVSVDDSTAAAVAEKTEGWVTGLHLAVLAMQGHDDPTGKLLELRGTTRYVMDYLTSELLDTQTAGIRQYLLASSILTRFNASLIDALCLSDEPSANHGIDGLIFVDWLLKNNLFVVPQDSENHWLRYHHLFLELLQTQLRQHSSVEEIAELHHKASQWFEREGFIKEAITHALAGEDIEGAATIVERHRLKEFIADRWYVVRKWLAMLPDDIKRQRPNLLLAEAWILQCRLDLAPLPLLVKQIEFLLSSHPADQRLLGELDYFKGYLDFWDGQSDSCQQHLERAVSALSSWQPYLESEALLLLGVSYCMDSRKELAIQILEDRMHSVGSPEGQTFSRLIAGLVFIHLVCGDLHQAYIQSQRLQHVAKLGNLRNTDAWSYYLLANSQLQAGKLSEAARNLNQAVQRRYEMEPYAAVDAIAGLALTEQLQGIDSTQTVAVLFEYCEELNDPEQLFLANSCQARLFLLQGDRPSAFAWARSASVSPSLSELFVWLEAPSLTRARILLASNSAEDLTTAEQLLKEISEIANAHQLSCQIIDVNVLQAIALQKKGQIGDALHELEKAVAWGAPRGWVRPFIEAGQPLAQLLAKLAENEKIADYVELIQASITRHSQLTGQGVVNLQALPQHTSSTTTHSLDGSSLIGAAFPIEPLTQRELDILELLSKRLRNKEIANTLHISPVTVKSHLRNIYQKLQVEKRMEAVDRAREHRILDC